MKHNQEQKILKKNKIIFYFAFDCVGSAWTGHSVSYISATAANDLQLQSCERFHSGCVAILLTFAFSLFVSVPTAISPCSSYRVVKFSYSVQTVYV